MQDFISRLLHNAHWVLFILLETLCGCMLFSLNAFQHSVWFTQANHVAGKVLKLEADILQYLQLKEINSSLTQENIHLQLENEALRMQIHTLTKDTTWMDKVVDKELGQEKLIPAQVISNSIRKKDNYIAVDKGTSAGVQAQMGVISSNGVVGVTYLVSKHYSLILPILNSHSNTSCRLRNSQYFGTLKWNGENPQMAFMDDIPLHASCQVGDTVETSGYSNIYPAGILVGTVVNIQHSEDGLSYHLEVKLNADLCNIRDVCIVTNKYKQEIDTLKVKIQ